MKIIMAQSLWIVQTNLLPLQSLTQFEIKTKSPLQIIVFVVFFAALVGIIVFLNVSKAFRNSKVFKGEAIGTGIKMNRAQVSSDFFKEAAKFGLTRQEAAKLEKILKVDGGDPIAALKDRNLLDDCFKTALQRLRRENRDDTVEIEIADLFSIRNIIEYYLISSGPNNNNRIIRSFPRRPINEVCSFCYVDMVKQEVNKKVIKKLVPQKETKSGTIINLSIGGAALRTTSAKAKAGQLLKIDFALKKQKVAVLGENLRINTEGGLSIMHIKFLKVSKKSLNIINNLIYRYE